MKKKILVLANFDDFYNTRKEVIKELLKEYEINICYPYGPNVEKFKEMGCIYTNINIDRRGVNPLKDLVLLREYKKILTVYKPDVVLTYSIKPNVYGGYWCGKLNIPFLANITGLGTALENPGILQKIAILLHRIGLKKVNTIFVQNEENKQFFIDHNLYSDRLCLIPGSGVNTEEFKYIEYPKGEEKHFLYIARVMKEKGIDEYLEAAKVIKKEYPNAFFHILGFCEEDYKEKLKDLEKQGIIQYHGLVEDVKEYHKFSCCTIHPSYYPEGMSNVLLEACACGRPIITTNRSGCREIVEDGYNGYMFEQKSHKDLIKKIKRFLNLKYEFQKEMGINARVNVTNKFNRNLIIDKYKSKIKYISN